MSEIAFDPNKARAARQKRGPTKAFRFFHAACRDAFGKRADESAPGMRDGMRHRLAVHVSGHTDSSKDLTEDELRDAAHLARDGWRPEEPEMHYAERVGADRSLLLLDMGFLSPLGLAPLLWSLPSVRRLTGYKSSTALIQCVSDEDAVAIQIVGHNRDAAMAYNLLAAFPQPYAERLDFLLHQGADAEWARRATWEDTRRALSGGALDRAILECKNVVRDFGSPPAAAESHP